MSSRINIRVINKHLANERLRAIFAARYCTTEKSTKMKTILITGGASYSNQENILNIQLLKKQYIY